MTEWLASQLTLKYKAEQSDPATAQRSQKAWISLLSQGHGSGVIFTVTWTIFTVSHRLFSGCHTLFLEPLLNLKHFEEKQKAKGLISGGADSTGKREVWLNAHVAPKLCFCFQSLKKMGEHIQCPQ